MANFLKKLQTWASGGDTSGAYEEAAKANDAAIQQLEAAKNIKTKDAETLMKEGRASAGVASADKAGEAKKQAKSSAVMNNASRLQAATAGASAASKAASEGFTDTANQSAQMAAQQDLANKQNAIDLAKQQADLTAQKGQQKITQAENEANRKSQMHSGLMSMIGAFSDGRVKRVHSYIPKEARSVN